MHHQINHYKCLKIFQFCFILNEFFFLRIDLGKVSKKCGIFHTLVGWVGGFLKKSFSTKKIVSKCIKSPKYSFKSNLFFSYGGVWHLEYFWVPDSGLFSAKDFSLGNSHEAIPLTILVMSSTSPAFPNSMLATWGDKFNPQRVGRLQGEGGEQLPKWSRGLPHGSFPRNSLW